MKHLQRVVLFMMMAVSLSKIGFAAPETKDYAKSEIVPIGISIKLGIEKQFGESRLVVTLNNHTDKPLRYVEPGTSLSGWRIKVFNSEGKLLGSSGYEQAIKGSFRDYTIPPGESKNFPLDIRWGVFRNKGVPDTCRVEIETPIFSDSHKDLSAKLTMQLKLSDEDSKGHER